MLDKQDLQAIKELIDSSITASEERTHAEIRASESRTQAEIVAVRAEIKAAEDRWMTFYESAVQPQLQLLAEGQQTILETLAPKSRVEALEEEVVFLKSVVRNLAQDVADLKQAQ